MWPDYNIFSEVLQSKTNVLLTHRGKHPCITEAQSENLASEYVGAVYMPIILSRK